MIKEKLMFIRLKIANNSILVFLELQKNHYSLQVIRINKKLINKTLKTN
jgi:hypothetical protein